MLTLTAFSGILQQVSLGQIFLLSSVDSDDTRINPSGMAGGTISPSVRKLGQNQL